MNKKIIDFELEGKVNQWYETMSEDNKNEIYSSYRKKLIIGTSIFSLIMLILSIISFTTSLFQSSLGTIFIAMILGMIFGVIIVLSKKEKVIKDYIRDKISKGEKPIDDESCSSKILMLEYKNNKEISEYMIDNFGIMSVIAYSIIKLETKLLADNEVYLTIDYGFESCKTIDLKNIDNTIENFIEESEKLFENNAIHKMMTTNKVKEYGKVCADAVRLFPKMLLLNYDIDVSEFDVFISDRDLLIQVFKSYWMQFFVYVRESNRILQDKQLDKILYNAFKKYEKVDVVCDKTYDIFLNHRISEVIDNETYRNILVFYYCEKMMGEFKIESLKEDLKNLNNNKFVVEVLKKITKDELIANITEQWIPLSLIFCNNLIQTKDLKWFIERVRNHDDILKAYQVEMIETDLLENDYSNKNRIRIEEVDLMSGIEFENLIAQIFDGLGYKTEITKASGDQGIDVLAEKNEFRIAIQAKCYSGVVGNHAVMEAVGGMKYYNADKCMVVTNRTFTSSAKSLAKVNNVELWDREKLIKCLSEIK